MNVEHLRERGFAWGFSVLLVLASAPYPRDVWGESSAGSIRCDSRTKKFSFDGTTFPMPSKPSNPEPAVNPRDPRWDGYGEANSSFKAKQLARADAKDRLEKAANDLRQQIESWLGQYSNWKASLTCTEFGFDPACTHVDSVAIESSTVGSTGTEWPDPQVGLPMPGPSGPPFTAWAEGNLDTKGKYLVLRMGCSREPVGGSVCTIQTDPQSGDQYTQCCTAPDSTEGEPSCCRADGTSSQCVPGVQ